MKLTYGTIPVTVPTSSWFGSEGVHGEQPLGAGPDGDGVAGPQLPEEGRQHAVGRRYDLDEELEVRLVGRGGYRIGAFDPVSAYRAVLPGLEGEPLGPLYPHQEEVRGQHFPSKDSDLGELRLSPQSGQAGVASVTVPISACPALSG